MIIWFGLMMLGMIFIGLALRDERRVEHQSGDPSVRRIPDPRELPLKQVRDALRPPRPVRPVASDTESRPGSAPAHRRRHTPRGPHGPHLVK